jgi:hypothetical protein
MNETLRQKFKESAVILEYDPKKDSIEDLAMFLERISNKGIVMGLNRWYMFWEETKSWRATNSLLNFPELPVRPLADFLTKEEVPFEVSNYNIF